MDTIPYKTILNDREKFNSILKNLKIEINDEDWIHEGYKIIEKIIHSVSSDQDFFNFVNENGKEYVRSFLFDLMILHGVLSYIEDEDKEILTLKLKQILSGTISEKETSENNRVRNILFEFTILSYLKKSGLNAKLCKDNPDIKFEVNNRTYCIQCKRTFNVKQNTINNSVKKAVRQLKTDINNMDSKCFGIIALSVDNYLGKRFPMMPSDDICISELNNFLYQFHNRYSGEGWMNPSIVDDPRIVGMFLYTANYVLIQDGMRQATVQLLHATNTHSPDLPLIKQYHSDIKQLIEI